ncbi:MAG: hypothetical protein LJE91_07095 [Gammaproteobacteria bacterium]|nr:hypothetical protein [Gammaproteobacteria bacterium]
MNRAHRDSQRRNARLIRARALDQFRQRSVDPTRDDIRDYVGPRAGNAANRPPPDGRRHRDRIELPDPERFPNLTGDRWIKPD